MRSIRAPSRPLDGAARRPISRIIAQAERGRQHFAAAGLAGATALLGFAALGIIARSRRKALLPRLGLARASLTRRHFSPQRRLRTARKAK
jgi:hypothetical protein